MTGVAHSLIKGVNHVSKFLYIVCDLEKLEFIVASSRLFSRMFLLKEFCWNNGVNEFMYRY